VTTTIPTTEQLLLDFMDEVRPYPTRVKQIADATAHVIAYEIHEVLTEYPNNNEDETELELNILVAAQAAQLICRAMTYGITV